MLTTQKRKLSRRQGELLLTAVIIARSTSFLCSKLVLESMGPFTLMAVRFLLAFALLAVIFYRRLSNLTVGTLWRSFVLGVSFFAVMTAELYGLRSTDSSTTSFLENTAIVFVPLLEALLLRRAPRPAVLGSSLVTMVGIGFLTLSKSSSFSFGRGEALCLLAALLYAISILLTDRLSRQGDAFIMGLFQVGFMGTLALIAALLFETPRLPETRLEWSAILWLSLVCSGFGFTLQPVAQRYTSAERAGMFCALSPVSAAILGTCLLHETLGLYGLIGAALVMTGILISTAHGKAVSPNA